MTERKERAAARVAADQLTNAKIAEEAGVSLRTLDNWNAEPEFLERVEWYQEESRKRLAELSITSKERRLADLDNLRRRIRSLIWRRANSEEMAGVPGGRTGLLNKRYRMVAEQLVEEYKFDAAIVKALADVDRQASQELGEWTEKVELNDKRTTPAARTLADAFTLEELEKIHARELARTVDDGGPPTSDPDQKE